MAVDPWGFDEDRQTLARRLRSRRLLLSAIRQGFFLLFLVVLLFGGSGVLRTWAFSFAFPTWAAIAVFLIILFVIGNTIGLPFSYVSGFRWEAKAGLSTRTLASWMKDVAKSFGLGLAFVVVAGEILLWLLGAMPTWWWVAAWALGLLMSLVLGFLAPILFVPLFFRFRPLEDPALRARLEALAASAGTPVVGVYEIEASAKTRRSNAAVMGFGRTRRIVVTDTLVREYSPDEVETVLAHELAHQKSRDPWIGYAVNSISLLVVLALAALAYAATYRAFGILAPDDMAGLPLLVLWGGFASAALGPVERWSSRRRERSADRLALQLTRKPSAFASAMVKLHDKNLGVAQPRRIEVWLFYSHPPGRERVDFARSFVAAS